MTTRAEDLFPVRRVRFELDVPLDESMCEHRGMRAAQLQGTLEAVEGEILTAKAAVKAKEKRRDELDTEIRELQRQIREGKGTVMVDAEERANFDGNCVDTIVLEGPMAGMVCSTRPMTADERQTAIDVDAALPPRDPPKQVKVRRKKDGPAEGEAPAPH